MLCCILMHYIIFRPKGYVKMKAKKEADKNAIDDVQETERLALSINDLIMSLALSLYCYILLLVVMILTTVLTILVITLTFITIVTIIPFYK